ncbi:hypothetical protein HWV62_39601 [Athelia sp. TMB]|nr:hypothetical protein HWV62_39601 [Athelia sp. TMB]
MAHSRSPPRNLSSSTRSFQGSQTTSSSRPFLNNLNPMARTYQGYAQANQSLVEEEDENENESGDEDVETGRGGGALLKSTRAQGKRKVAWDAGTSEMNALRPNIHKEDKNYEQDSSDDEVPQDFMIEASSPMARAARGRQQAKGKGRAHKPAAPPVLPSTLQDVKLSIPPRPSELQAEEPVPSYSSEPSERHSPKPMRGLDAYERALWNWVNVYNLDAYLQEVYYYYEGKGIYSIALARGLNLLTVGFVIGFSTFLLGCIDYSRLRPEGINHLSDVVVDRCVTRFSGFTFLFFMLFTAFYVWQIISFVLGIFRLIDMYNFYTHLLRIPDADIPTISWPEVVRRIGAIREDNPLTAISSAKGSNGATSSAAKLDAHDIANRIMRQENYLIALFNKELLDLRVPLPPTLERLLGGPTPIGPEGEGKGKMLTRALEWNLRFCLMEFLFDAQGRVRKVFLKNRNRTALIEGLKRRFIFMGILNAIFAPFIVLYLLMYSFFRYFEEYHKNPSNIGGRRYTPFAQWKFREFNELPHLFARRLNESYPTASMYIGQFPNEKMTLLARFVAFISGSFAAVLLLATVIDPDLFLYFEVTPHRTVFFYLGLSGSIMAAARGIVPEDNRVFDPELLMEEVIHYTHYMPDEWKDQLHSKQVHQEFGELFAMKIMIFLQEISSVVLTPFVLWFSLPQCAPAIIDFFHDFTVHIPGRGYVCSFAEFDFARHGNVKFGAPTPTADQKMLSREGKMEKSFLNFKAANPDWNPTDPSGSLYLSRMADITATQTSPRRRRTGLVGDTTMTGTILRLGERKQELAERAQAYEQALKQSQHAAVARRRHPPGSGSVMATSGNMPAVGGASSSMWQSGIGGAAMAQTAVLGDSQGSVHPAANAAARSADTIKGEDLAADGGVGSGLGDSYVDGKGVKAYNSQHEDREEEDGMDDGGVLGLLAQIYGAKGQGPARVI